MDKVVVIYSHHKVGDLIWQLPFIRSLSLHHGNKIILITQETTQAAELYSDCDFIEEVIYNKFRKKLFYFAEIFKLYKIIKKINPSHVYLLDKISRPAIAAKFAYVKNIIGPGIGNQKRWLTNKFFLELSDTKLDYANQTKKFFLINNIKIQDSFPKIKIPEKKLEFFYKKYEKYEMPWVTFGVDSYEPNKIWYEENFNHLAENLLKIGRAKSFFLVAHPSRKDYVDRIISLNKKINYVDCSQIRLLEFCSIVLKSSFYVGNDSGPLNLSAILGVKSFGLVGPTSASAHKLSNIIIIKSKDYDGEVEKDATIKVYSKPREIMKGITVEKVLDKIMLS
jgi:heptosyltransferase-2